MTIISNRPTLEKFGTILFRYRAWIAVPFFVLLVLLSRPVVYPFLAYTLVITGLVIRLWAAGYIGVSARGTSFATRFRITTGPYKFLRHPLYLGNFFLVIGVATLFNPPLIYGLMIMALFIVMYGVIMLSENMYIEQLSEKKVKFNLRNCKGEISTLLVLLVILLMHLVVPKNRS
jgi:protein-S-isoprenylcysteine O-methyltransferase Ste14